MTMEMRAVICVLWFVYNRQIGRQEGIGNRPFFIPDQVKSRHNHFAYLQYLPIHAHDIPLS